jgi:hypothetical protein
MESQYRSIVGKALPCDETLCGGSNPVRELAKYFSNPEERNIGRLLRSSWADG